MGDVNAALVAFLAIGTFPLAAWVGAVLARPGGRCIGSWPVTFGQLWSDCQLSPHSRPRSRLIGYQAVFAR